MITHLKLQFDMADGLSPSQIDAILKSLGCKAMTGEFDYYFYWGKDAKGSHINPQISDIIVFTDKIYKALHGKSSVRISFETR